MKLTIIDRLTLLNGFFQEHTNILNLTLIKEISDKIAVTSKELIAVDFDVKTNMLDPEKNEKQVKSFKFSDTQKELILNRIKELSEKDEVTMQILNIYNKLK